MQQYIDLAFNVRQNGYSKDDRTGTGTTSLFGYQMRFDLQKGFPLVTVKKTNFDAIKVELDWFLKGLTNANYLRERNCKIWDEWAITEEQADQDYVLSFSERYSIYAETNGPIDDGGFAVILNKLGLAKDPNQLTEDQHHQILDFLSAPRTIKYKELGIEEGECGPIYGRQWRSWFCPDGRVIDQIAEVIQLLKTKPDSRRLIVNAWNPFVLPDESKSPHENVLMGRMSLAPCHVMFQFYSREMTLSERLIVLKNIHTEYPGTVDDFRAEHTSLDDAIEALDRFGIPKRSLSCQLYQRSADLFLGVPFNIASYVLLTHMVAQVTGHAVGEFIHTFGDVHFYNNHLKQVDEILTRKPKPLPKLWLNPIITDIFNFTVDDILIEGYDPHPFVAGKVSV